MKYDSLKHHRRSIRLKDYDYSSNGAYFITVCTHNKMEIFGDVVRGEMRLNQNGKIATAEWKKSAIIRSEITLDAFIVMPNHIHGIIIVGAHGCAPNSNNDVHDSNNRAHSHAPLRRPPRSIGSFVAGYKSAVTTRINKSNNTIGLKIWQRNYYEHIIQNEKSLEKIRDYIEGNPLEWEKDNYNPNAVNAVKDELIFLTNKKL